MSSSRVVTVINLGRMGFLQAFDIQLRCTRQHLDFLAGRLHGGAPNTLLLVEHNPVYTVGLRTEKYDEIEEKRLKKLGAEFFRTNRGGLISYHGPGQLVAYPVLNLRHFQDRPSMKQYIGTLENTLINTCRRFGIQARTTEHTGVWVGDRKIAAIGVHGSRYIVTHGVSLNCNTDLSWFRHIVPCGIEGREVTSITQERNKDTPIEKVVGPFLSAFQEEFECELEYGMLDEKDASFCKNQDGDASGVGGTTAGSQTPPLQASAQYSMRQMSTATTSDMTPLSPRRKVSMW